MRRKNSGMIVFKSKQSFNQRTDGHFDWYASWGELDKYLNQYITPESEILMVGCGNSSK
jgi:hypothetical protein